MLLVGILPSAHAVPARFDRDDVAAHANLPHRFAHHRRLLVWNLVVARAVNRQEWRHALVHGEQRRHGRQLRITLLLTSSRAKEPDAVAVLLMSTDRGHVEAIRIR